MLNHTAVQTVAQAPAAVLLDSHGAPVDAVTSGYRTAALTKGKVDGSVSRQWATRPDDQKFLSLDALREAIAQRTTESTTVSAALRSMRVNHEGGLTLDVAGNGSTAVEFTHWSFGQLCSLIGAPAGYMRKLPEKLAAINLQYGLMSDKEEDRVAYVQENGSTVLRALTSDGYGRIYDLDVVKEVQKIAGNGIGDTRWKVPGQIDWSSHKDGTVVYNPFVDITKENTTLYASDRDVYMFLVDDTHPIEVGKLANGEPDLMFRGFITYNSEVGSKALGIKKFLLRGVCQNRNLWGVESSVDFTLRHSRMAPERFAKEAAPILASYSEADSRGIVAKVWNAKQAIVAKTDEERLEFLTDRAGLTKAIAEKALAAVLNEENTKAESVWDMVQGITAVARGIQHQDARLELEAKAGKMMSKISA